MNVAEHKDWFYVWEDDDGICLQESEEKKDRWLEVARQRFPIGSRVKVILTGDPFLETFIGEEGVVVGYAAGISGDWPMVRVMFRGELIECFYADGKDAEIVPI